MKGVRVHVQRADESAVRVGRTGFSAIRRAAFAAADAMDVTEAELSFTLLGDQAMAGLNHRYLSHDGPTDVLSFPLFEEGEAPVGDIYIGVEQAARQASAHGVPLTEELARLAIHGTLHVLGMDHPEDAGRETSEMWIAQERILDSVMPA
jgi:probable rRNA maturation factor